MTKIRNFEAKMAPDTKFLTILFYKNLKSWSFTTIFLHTD